MARTMAKWMAMAMAGMMMAAAAPAAAGAGQVQVGPALMEQGDFQDLAAMIEGTWKPSAVATAADPDERIGLVTLPRSQWRELADRFAGRYQGSTLAVQKPEPVLQLGLLRITQSELDGIRSQVENGPLGRLIAPKSDQGRQVAAR